MSTRVRGTRMSQHGNEGRCPRERSPPPSERGHEGLFPLTFEGYQYRYGRCRGADPDAVLPSRVVERRHVHRLFHLRLAIAAEFEQVGVTTAVGVVHLGDDGTLRIVLVVTPEHADRIEGVAETPCPREHHHAGRRDPTFLQEASYVHVVFASGPRCTTARSLADAEAHRSRPASTSPGTRTGAREVSVENVPHRPRTARERPRRDSPCRRPEMLRPPHPNGSHPHGIPTRDTRRRMQSSRH